VSEPDIIRAPNHLGDLVMALPALGAAVGADIQVVRWLVPILEMARASVPGGSDVGRVLPLDPGAAGMRKAVNELRVTRYERGVLLPPSFSAALVFYLGRVRQRRGSPTDGRSALLTDPVQLAGLNEVHRALSYHVLVTGSEPPEPPVPRISVSEAERTRWREGMGLSSAPVLGVFPGSNASSRRWDAGRYAELVRRVSAQGIRVLVFGGAGERDLTRWVAGDDGIDLGGRTDLRGLAVGLATCELLVTNDSGPMHLAAAVGTRTLSLQGPADPRVTRPLGEGHRMIRADQLPCVPCVKNSCPRRGRGFILSDADRECMRLIEVGTVESAVTREWSLLLTRTMETDCG
jgi:heptosyltransferase II